MAEDSDDDASFNDAYDYLEETQYDHHELHDCHLSDEALQEVFTGGDENPAWHDLLHSDNPPIIWRPSGINAVFVSAFRNGSESIATAISTVHRQHHWEAIVLKPAELREYSRDSTSLKKNFFQFVKLPGLIGDEEEEVTSIMEDLQEEKIEPQTLRQGEFFLILFILSICVCGVFMLINYFPIKVLMIGTWQGSSA